MLKQTEQVDLDITSEYHLAGFTDRVQEYASVKHYVLSQQAQLMGFDNVNARIANARTSEELNALEAEFPTDEHLLSIRFKIIQEGYFLKFSQNADLRNRLLQRQIDSRTTTNKSMYEVAVICVQLRLEVMAQKGVSIDDAIADGFFGLGADEAGYFVTGEALAFVPQVEDGSQVLSPVVDMFPSGNGNDYYMTTTYIMRGEIICLSQSFHNDYFEL